MFDIHWVSLIRTGPQLYCKFVVVSFQIKIIHVYVSKVQNYCGTTISLTNKTKHVACVTELINQKSCLCDSSEKRESVNCEDGRELLILFFHDENIRKSKRSSSAIEDFMAPMTYANELSESMDWTMSKMKTKTPVFSCYAWFLLLFQSKNRDSLQFWRLWE